MVAPKKVKLKEANATLAVAMEVSTHTRVCISTVVQSGDEAAEHQGNGNYLGPQTSKDEPAAYSKTA